MQENSARTAIQFCAVLAISLGAFATAACAGGPSRIEAPKSPPPVVKYTPPQPPPPFDDDAQCPAARLQNLVGKPKSALDTLRLKGPVRFERPGQMVTMEYSPSRTRISLDGKGIITAIRCG